jgi:hypothetical protein
MMKKIDLKPIETEQIDSFLTQEKSLWIVKYDSTVYGPYEQEYLKEYSQLHIDLFQEAQASPWGEENWKEFFKCQPFQRRKPSLVPAQSLVTPDQFYVLQNGLKQGPYTIEKLQEMVQVKDVLLTDQVSTDEGLTWIRIYQHHQFDRRLKNQENTLPKTLQAPELSQAQAYTENLISQKMGNEDKYDAIVNLAHIGGKHRHTRSASQAEAKSNSHDENLSPEPKPTKQTKNSVKRSYVVASFIAVFLLATLYNEYNNSYSESQSKQALVPTQTHKTSINNSGREIASERIKPATNAQVIKPLPKVVQPTVKPRHNEARNRPQPKRGIASFRKRNTIKEVHSEDQHDDQNDAWLDHGHEDPEFRDPAIESLKRDIAGNKDMLSSEAQDYIEDEQYNDNYMEHGEEEIPYDENY